MLLHPKLAAKTILTNFQESDYQPNAIDIRLDKVFMPFGLFSISEEEKIHAKVMEIQTDDEGFYILDPGFYQISFLNEIHVDKEEAGWVITRSTLIRNGVSITSGLYDSGYVGKMVAGLNCSLTTTKIKKGTRIGQYLSVSAQSTHLYNGDYQEG